RPHILSSYVQDEIIAASPYADLLKLMYAYITLYHITHTITWKLHVKFLYVAGNQITCGDILKL
ncbi:hypothetical protein Q6296_29525, partial [Klebsiella variicola]|uniref:hypothetical protein n=1 Tax=Klebsiella variicola TaxID=244366 RepID=UPI00272F5F73